MEDFSFVQISIPGEGDKVGRTGNLRKNPGRLGTGREAGGKEGASSPGSWVVE